MNFLYFMLGVVLTAPTFLAIGLFAGRDRSPRHEPADITAALARKGKWR